jgi:hypothetical protein
MNLGALSIALQLLEEEHGVTYHYVRSVFVGISLNYHLRILYASPAFYYSVYSE